VWKSFVPRGTSDGWPAAMTRTNTAAIKCRPRNPECSTWNVLTYVRDAIVRQIRRTTCKLSGALVMQTEQEDHGEDNGGKENLSDAIVEDLLIGIGGVGGAGLFGG
jgi:hypothetical protein